MARATRAVAEILAGILRSTEGLPKAIAERSRAENLHLEEIGEDRILAANLPPAADLARMSHPAVRVYCDRVANEQREKFRRFSGWVRAVVEVWLSAETVHELERRLQLYTEAVTDVLESNRGDWGQGIVYGGNYEIQFSAPKGGGRNYVQSAKVLLRVEVSQP